MTRTAPSLWLLRHAQPLIAPGTCYGRLDVAADASLTTQAAQHWLAALPAGAVLRHSPLQRCVQLAQALQPQGTHPALADARLQEMDFGRWEGQAWDALPRAELDAWAQDLSTYAPGGGEALHAMLQRVQAALHDSWRSDSLHGMRDVVWVTHAGVIRCVQWLLQFGQALPTAARWNLPAPAFGQGTCLPWAAHATALHALHR